MFKILCASTRGEDEFPPWPEFDDLWESIIVPFFQMGAPAVLCVGVAAIPVIVYGVTPVGILCSILLGIGGCFYLPMALLAIALNGSVTAMKPQIVLPAIRSVFGPYLVAFLLLTGVATFSTVLQVAVSQRVLFLDIFANAVISTFLIAVEMRILGLQRSSGSFLSPPLRSSGILRHNRLGVQR